MVRVSDNKHFLVHEDGTPFFYLGDTAWAIFQRLNREEADHYLQDRATKGFTVIQAVALSEFDALKVPNRYGDLPLQDGDPTRPSEAYFRHVDYVVEKAASLGLIIGMLPTWGDKVGPLKWGKGPQIFTPENAPIYGEFLGERYGNKPIIWILGGDRNPETEQQKAIWQAMAEGLKSGDKGRNLVTYHPQGVFSSSQFFHNEPWLDFNMLQSCHLAWDRDNYNLIAHDYNLVPTKPCMDSEPNYEGIHLNVIELDKPCFTTYDVRKAAYWALFAGAHGHTYGANGVFQFWNGEERNPFGARVRWDQALDLPGASQMQYVRQLLESRPFLNRIPDQSLLISDPGTGANHIQATRADDGSYAFIYSAAGNPFTLDLRKLSGETLSAYWFDPRTGITQILGNFPTGASRKFRPPSQGKDNDWVLILDDADKGYDNPGLPV